MMKTEEEIREELKSYKESFAHRNMSDALDKLIGGMEKTCIEVLEWVLNDEVDNDN